MADNISVNHFSAAVVGALSDEAQRIYVGLETITKKISKEALAEIKRDSPSRTGDYRKGWKRKKQDSGYVIYNTNYRLPHLVERDTRNRAGGITRGKAHIQPAEERAFAKIETEVVKMIEGGN